MAEPGDWRQLPGFPLTRPEVALYRFYDRDGVLLYVGISEEPRVRFVAHRRRAPWWHAAASYSLERLPYRNAALDAELHAIRTEYPLYNRAGVVR